MSTKLAAAALVVSALVYVSVRTLREDTQPAHVPEPTAPLVAGEPRGAEPRGLSAPTAHDVRVDASATRPAPAPDLRAPSDHEQSPHGLWLVGQLLGLDGLDPTEAVIHVRAHQRSLTAHGQADGTYQVDVNSLEPASLDRAAAALAAMAYAVADLPAIHTLPAGSAGPKPR